MQVPPFSDEEPGSIMPMRGICLSAAPPDVEDKAMSRQTMIKIALATFPRGSIVLNALLIVI
jgi:hypothetical protein